MNTKQLRKIIRKNAGVSGISVPIIFVEGDSKPECIGNKAYYTNKRGDVIRHPSAYKKAWGKPIYHTSTMAIKVGMEWPMNVGLTACLVKSV